MPNNFPSYTKCCDPGNYQGVPVVAAVVFTGAGLAGLIAAIVQAGVTGLGLGAPLLGIGLCAAGIAFCIWWLDTRLICLGGDRSATGAVYSLEPFKFSSDIFDTDYSFNLLLWNFMPQHVLPQSFVSNEWSSLALGQLATDWATLPPLVPNIAWATVSDLVTLIAAQPTIAQPVATYGISFNGQGVAATDVVTPPLQNSSTQHFILHCEIEGPGMHDLLIMLIGLLALFVAALLVDAIPVVGPALSIFLSWLAIIILIIGGGAITNSPTTPPTTGGWGGSFNPFRPGDNPNQPVDLAYVYGRWVCDSGFMHGASNELHPVYYMCKIGTTTQGAIAGGQWPGTIETIQVKLDNFFAYINSPPAAALQAQPENQWTVHPVLDGCIGATPYPQPPPPIV